MLAAEDAGYRSKIATDKPFAAWVKRNVQPHKIDGYAAVTLGLLHGSQPDAIVVCHEARRRTHAGCLDYPLPDLVECIDTHLAMGRRTNPKLRCVGVCLNTRLVPAGERQAWLEEIALRTKVTCVDPLVEGPAAIVDELLKGAPSASPDHARTAQPATLANRAPSSPR